MRYTAEIRDAQDPTLLLGWVRLSKMLLAYRDDGVTSITFPLYRSFGEELDGGIPSMCLNIEQLAIEGAPDLVLCLQSRLEDLPSLRRIRSFKENMHPQKLKERIAK